MSMDGLLRNWATICGAALLVLSASSIQAQTVQLVVVDVKAVALGLQASKVIGMDVRNSKVEKIGSIDDLIITPDHSLSYAVVSVGGFLGLGRRLVAIPVEQLRDEKGKLILPGATKEALKALPEFQYAA